MTANGRIEPVTSGKSSRSRATIRRLPREGPLLMVSRPRVSDVVNQKTSKLTIDTLVEMQSRMGKQVQLVVG